MNKNVFLAVLLPLSMLLASCGEKNAPENPNKLTPPDSIPAVSYIKLSDFAAYLPAIQIKSVGYISEDYNELYVHASDLKVSDTINNVSAELTCETYTMWSEDNGKISIALSCNDGKTVKGTYMFDDLSKKLTGTVTHVATKEGDLPETLDFKGEDGAIVLQLTKDKGITLIQDPDKRVYKPMK